MTNLPSHWVDAPLSTVARQLRGVTYSKDDLGDGPGIGYLPVLRATNVSDAGLDLSDGTLVWVRENCIKEEQILRSEDCLIVASSGSRDVVGRAALFKRTDRAAFGAFCTVLRPFSQVQGEYLGYYLRSEEYRAAVSAASAGTNINNIKRSFFDEHVIPLAPFAEQQRIVAALDERLSELDASVASLERAERNLVRYRAAVLAAACSGTLVLTTQEITPRPLRELIKDLGQGWSPKCDLTREAVPGEWAVVTTTAVQPLRYLDNQGKLLPSNLEPRPRLEILAGDFLMTRKGPRKRAGVACLVRSTRAKLMVCDTVYRFRHIESAVTANYLEIALNSPAVVAAIDKQKAGISESGVSLTHDKLGEIRIPVPPLAEQARILEEVDRHLSRADALAASIAQSKRRAQRLRRAILAAAFQGRLVPQDPNDEPASVLLDRIRAQAATAEAATAAAPRRGRPSAQPAPPVATAYPPAMTPKRRGRPPGAKNKAKS